MPVFTRDGWRGMAFQYHYRISCGCAVLEHKLMARDLLARKTYIAKIAYKRGGLLLKRIWWRTLNSIVRLI